MKFLKSAFLCACLSCLLPFASGAQYMHTFDYSTADPDNVMFKRMDLGFSMPFPKLHFHCEYQTLEPGYSYSVNRADVNYINNVTDADMHTSGAMGFTGAYAFPIASFSKKSRLAIGAGVQVSTFHTDIDGKDFRVSAFNTTSSLTMLSGALPVSFDFKTGADAVCDKYYRTMFTFGIGAYPCFIVSQGVYEVEDGRFKVVPFVKSEFGVFAGIAFKVRATYTLGGFSYSSSETSRKDSKYDKDVKSDVLITSKPELTLSFVLLPFSFAWENSGGW